MTLPSAIQLATLIVVVAGAASKELELSRGFWGWFPPVVARWLPTALAVLGALPALFSGVTNWDGFSMGLLAAVGVGLKHAHDPLPPPAESDGVDSTPRTVRTGDSAGGGMAFKAREKRDERLMRQREHSFRPVGGFARLSAFRTATVIAFLFAMVFAFLLACVSCSPSSKSAPGGDATALEAAIIVQVREVQTDADGVDTAVYLADCNGVAVGQTSILTATHCMSDRQHAIGDTVYFVDADTWFARRVTSRRAAGNHHHSSELIYYEEQ